MKYTLFCTKCDREFETIGKLLKHVFLHKIGLVMKDEV